MHIAELKVDVVEERLDNGLMVLVAPMETAPVVSVWSIYRVGSRHEHLGITGISHWVEHMLFKGSEKYPKGEISRVIQKHGGQLNGQTWHDYTAYYETLPKAYADIGFDIEADRMANASFDPEETELERGVILAELEMYDNHPEHQLYDALAATVYKVHPYRNPVIGWRSDLEAMTRDQLYEHYRAFYSPDNAILVVAGDISPDAALDKAQNYFGAFESAGSVPKVASVTEPLQNGERRVTVRGHAEVPQLVLAYHAPSFDHPDLYPLRLAESILSHGRSSRLYQALVETRQAVSASASLHESRDAGVFSVWVTLMEGVRPSDVEAIVLRELQQLKSVPPSSAELEKAINQHTAGFVFGVDSVTERAFQVGIHEIMGDYNWLNSYLEKMGEVTAEQVSAAVERCCTAENRTVGFFEPIRDIA